MANGKRGGAREGAGRPVTGVKTKCYTITLPLDEAMALEKRAKETGKSVNKYIRDMILSGGQYGNVNLYQNFCEDITGLAAAEEDKPYKIEKE